MNLTIRYAQFFGPALIGGKELITAELLAASDCHVALFQDDRGLMQACEVACVLLASTRNVLVDLGDRRAPVGAIIETRGLTPRTEVPEIARRAGGDADRLAIALTGDPGDFAKQALAICKTDLGLLIPLPAGFEKADAMRLWRAAERARPLMGRGIWIEDGDG